MVWTQTKPGVWTDEYDGAEKVFYGMSQAFKAIGREHGSVYMVCQINISDNDNSEPTAWKTSLAQAWRRLRFDFPSLTVFEQDGKKQYLEPTRDRLDKWADDTFSVNDAAESATQIIPMLHLQKLPRLVFILHSSELLFHCSHWRIDALGACMVMDRFFDLLDGTIAGKTIESPPWEQEHNNLSPSLEDAYGSSETTMAVHRAKAEEIRKRNFDTAYPSAGLPYHDGPTPGLSHTQAIEFTQESTASLISACKAAGISITAAVHAACAAAVFERATDRQCDSYSTVVSVNVRNLLPPSARQYVCGTYVTGITHTLSRVGGNFTSWGKQLTAGYKASSWGGAVYMDALREIYRVHGEMLADLAAAASQKGPPPSNVTVSSLGVLDGKHLRADHGCVQVEAFRLGSSIMTRQPTLYIWTFRGSLTLSVDYNEGYYGPGDISGLLASIMKRLGKELRLRLTFVLKDLNTQDLPTLGGLKTKGEAQLWSPPGVACPLYAVISTAKSERVLNSRPPVANNLELDDITISSHRLNDTYTSTERLRPSTRGSTATSTAAEEDKDIPPVPPLPTNQPEIEIPGSDTTKQEPPPGPATTQYVSGWKLVTLLGSLTLIVFLILLDQTIISTAVPVITADLNALSDIGWYAGAYQLASGALQPLTGKLYTFFRLKWVFLLFLFLFELGSLVCGAATSSPMLIAGRAIAGAGSAGLANGGWTIISAAVPIEKRPLHTGTMMGVGQIGLIVAPLIGGALTQYVTWRWCFYINLPIGAVSALCLILIDIPETLSHKDKRSLPWRELRKQLIQQLDLIGFVLFAPASTMFLLALQFGADNKYAWNSSTIIGLFCGAGVTGILFALWERRAGDVAMIPGKVIGTREVWASCGNIFSMTFVVFVANFYLPVYFQAVKGTGPTMSGVYLLPGILSQLVFIVLSGALVSKLGYYMPWTLFSGVMTSVGGGLATTFRPDTSVDKWVGYQILQGIGRGAGMQMSMIATQNALGAHLIPISMSLLIFCQNLAGAIAVVVATTIFTQSLLGDLPLLAPSVSPAAAIAAGSGADSVRRLVPEGSPELDGLLLAYSYAVDKTFYMVAAFGVASFVFGLGMGWKDVRKKSGEKEEKPAPAGDVVV
ncbi:major facilitator superfamily domain-containing protein [Rhypophila decipiens]|uniref:Major facilitator superfamily domain-containing protein n=1 Tax=Rhypophila decipiens TaxID=261697 RepID=A0AAN6YAJ3_9PEZI|nr:major facilitator superfamily domain-containing protein [Rhypophila decipiens]